MWGSGLLRLWIWGSGLLRRPWRWLRQRNGCCSRLLLRLWIWGMWGSDLVKPPWRFLRQRNGCFSRLLLRLWTCGIWGSGHSGGGAPCFRRGSRLTSMNRARQRAICSERRSSCKPSRKGTRKIEYLRQPSTGRVTASVIVGDQRMCALTESEEDARNYLIEALYTMYNRALTRMPRCIRCRDKRILKHPFYGWVSSKPGRDSC